MPWMVVHVSQTPPEDQPWLISTRGDLARDETEMESIKAAYAAACPMPSAESDKLAWLKAAAAFSQRKRMEEFDLSFPDPPDVLPSDELVAVDLRRLKQALPTSFDQSS